MTRSVRGSSARDTSPARTRATRGDVSAPSSMSTASTAHEMRSKETSRLATHAFVRVSHAHTTPSSSPLSKTLSVSLTANAVTRPECPPKNATGTTGSPWSASPVFVSQRTMLPSSPPVHLVVVASPSAASARASTNAVAQWRGGTDGHAPAATSSGRMAMVCKMLVLGKKHRATGVTDGKPKIVAKTNT